MQAVEIVAEPLRASYGASGLSSAEVRPLLELLDEDAREAAISLLRGES